MASRVKSTRRGAWHYKECGLDNVYLVGIEVRTDPRTGSREPVIPQFEDLHNCIFLSLLRKRARLSGKEVRYLRRHLCWTQTVAARKLALSGAQYWCTLESPGKRAAFSNLSMELVWRLLCLEEFAKTASGVRREQAAEVRTFLEAVAGALNEIKPRTSRPVQIVRKVTGRREVWEADASRKVA